ncbi:MAG: hypothetical protein P8X42_13135 [Calditrichaceae bacterium]
MIDLLICAFIYAQPATNLQIIEDETKVIFDSIALKLPVNPDVIRIIQIVMMLRYNHIY